MNIENPSTNPTKDELHIAGFWRRSLAFIIDGVVLVLICLCLGLFFPNYLSDMGPWGVLVGFGVAVIYFTLLESNIAGGQSVGKTVLKLKVVSRDGEHLSLLKSLVRSTIVCCPITLGQLPSGEGEFFPILSVGIVVAILYLYIFNRKTRQALQDIAVNSIVVKTNYLKPASFTEVIWRGHYVWLVIICAAVIGASVGIGSLIRNTPSTIALQNLLQKEPDVIYVMVKEMSGNSMTLSSPGQTLEVNAASPIKSISVLVWIKNKENLNSELMAKQFEKIIRNTIPDVDATMLVITHGYNIGFVSSLHTKAYQFHSESFKQKQAETLQRELEILKSGD